MAAPNDGAQSILAVACRISALDVNGFPPVGANAYTTDTLIKATLSPVTETGVEIVTVGADGNLHGTYKHGDMIKYWTIALDLVAPDPNLENLLCGGTILSDTGTALVTPTTLATTPAITGGSLAAGTYDYRLTACNQYGETLAEAEVPAVVASGVAGSVALAWSSTTGAAYYRVYGRTAGAEQFLFQTTALTWTDTGLIVPNGALPLANTTAGPGAGVGYQDPPLGIVGNPNMVSVELWAQAWVKNAQATSLPFWRYVFPGCRAFHREASDVNAARFVNTYSGLMMENPNWGSGPMGDWEFDSSRVRQRARCGSETVPPVGFAAVAETN